MKRSLILLTTLVAFGTNAEVIKLDLPLETAVFKQVPGVQFANGQCLTCHSADYISMQPPKGVDFWQAEVKKMKEKYGAPIPPEQMDELVAYMAGTYGTGTNAPALAVVARQSSDAAIDPQALALRSGCLGCHNVQIKVVGPAYKDVAAKYRGHADAMERVSHQITHGGSGQWGQVMMPPFTQFSPAEINALAQWVLDQK